MKIDIAESKQIMGERAAALGAERLREALRRDGHAAIVLATGASQFEMLAALVAEADIDWGRVTAFHLDEYVGLPASHPASFRRYMRERFVERLPGPIGAFHYIDGEADPVAEIARLSALLRRNRLAVAFVGIGENGHLAFNDPPADLETDEPYLLVTLDEASRRQQLGEGWFPSIESVPREAISMSIRQILSADTIVCTVPDQRKAEAVRAAVEGPITSEVPASVLQRHPRCHLFLDRASASLLSSAVAS